MRLPLHGSRTDAGGPYADEPYADRRAAGVEVAARLREYAERDDVVVLGLPRGGVPVAAVVAGALQAPLDVLVVRKLGVPGHEELAMGALAALGDRVEVVRADDVLAHVRVSDAAWQATLEREQQELGRRSAAFRGARPAPELTGRVVILVDDGLATGSTMRAAVAIVRQFGAARVVVAVPVGSASTCARLSSTADQVVCAWCPDPFYAVGQAYREFDQTSDEEVRRLLGVR